MAVVFQQVADGQEQQGGEDHWNERLLEISDESKRGAGRLALSLCLS